MGISSHYCYKNFQVVFFLAHIVFQMLKYSLPDEIPPAPDTILVEHSVCLCPYFVRLCLLFCPSATNLQACLGLEEIVEMQ